MTTFNRLQYQSGGSEKVVLARLRTSAAFAKSATDYWTVTLWKRHPQDGAFAGDTVGVTVGSAFSTASRSLGADDPVTLYDDEAGTPLESGDSLWATYVSTGTPTILPNAAIEIDLQDMR